MLKFVFALPMIGHGLAHISGFLASWTSIDAGYSPKPWIFSPGITLAGPVGRFFGLLWLAASIVLLSSGFGIIFLQNWWPTFALYGAIISLIVIVPWWNTVPPGAKIGAVFDVIVLVIVLTPLKEKVIGLIS